VFVWRRIKKLEGWCSEMEKSTYDICMSLVNRHKELKKTFASASSPRYGQDTELYNSLDELEIAMKKFNEDFGGQNAKS